SSQRDSKAPLRKEVA
ncbi:hypothetical protein ECEC1869_3598, partial [Escherichia coli EC1869]